MKMQLVIEGEVDIPDDWNAVSPDCVPYVNVAEYVANIFEIFTNDDVTLSRIVMADGAEWPFVRDGVQHKAFVPQAVVEANQSRGSADG